MQECSLFSTPSLAFVVGRLFDDGHSDQCEVISHCREIISISLIISNVEHLFLCLLAIWASQVALVVKNKPANTEDIRNMCLIPG